MNIIEKIHLKIRQRFCKHKLGLFYMSHYPTIHCTKCNAFAGDKVNSQLGEYVDKITDNKLKN